MYSIERKEISKNEMAAKLFNFSGPVHVVNVRKLCSKNINVAVRISLNPKLIKMLDSK